MKVGPLVSTCSLAEQHPRQGGRAQARDRRVAIHRLYLLGFSYEKLEAKLLLTRDQA